MNMDTAFSELWFIINFCLENVTVCLLNIFWQAEQVWNYCREQLKYSTEAVKDSDWGLSHSRTVSYNGVEFDSTSSAKIIIQKAIANLPSKKKEIILDCLREKNFPLQVLKDDQGTLSKKYQNLFSGWASIPRRYLRRKTGKRRVLRTASAPGPALSPADLASPGPTPEPIPEPSDNDYPSPSDNDYPSPSDIIYPSPLTEKVAPIPSQDNNNNRKYLIAAVVASAMAGLAVVALILLFCLKKDRRVELKDGQRDEKPLLNVCTSNISAGMLEIMVEFLS